MPQRPEFDLNSQTIAPLYGRVGVLEYGNSKESILGAYYDRDENYKGLYVITSTGIKYFDLPPEQLYSVGITGYSGFNFEGTEYLLRELDEEDGFWMSAYKTELPIPVLQQMIISKSRSVIEEITRFEISDEVPQFEAMYVYQGKDANRISAIIYMSSYGVYSRNDAEWNIVNLEVPELQNLYTEDVDPNKANELLNLYDDNLGFLSVKEAMKYTLKKVEE